MSALEAVGFYDHAEPLHPDVAELRRVLRQVEMAALHEKGPLAHKRREDTLQAIGRAVQGLFG